MKKKRFRRRVYQLGSLAHLGFVLSWIVIAFLFQHHLTDRSYRLIEVIYWSPGSGPNPLNYVNDKFIKIVLTGGSEENIALENARQNIRKLIHQSDTTLGIEFVFSEKSKYSTLVRLYDICDQENVHTYINYQDKFWIFNFQHRRDSFYRNPALPDKEL